MLSSKGGAFMELPPLVRMAGDPGGVTREGDVTSLMLCVVATPVEESESALGLVLLLGGYV